MHQNIYNYPKNKFVASFIGSPQMNFLTEIVTKDKHRMSVVIGNEIDMYINLNQMHLFDMETEERI